MPVPTSTVSVSIPNAVRAWPTVAMSTIHADDKPDVQQEEVVADGRPSNAMNNTEGFAVDDESRPAESHGSYKVYKRRFFGLAQLVLLNIVVSWDVREKTNHVHTLAQSGRNLI